MNSINVEKEDLSNEENNNFEKEENEALNERKQNIDVNNNIYKQNKSTNKYILIIIFIIFIFIALFSIFIYYKKTSRNYFEKIYQKFNLRKSKVNNTINDDIINKNKTIIEDNNNPLDNNSNKTKNETKIGIAFIYSTLYSNGIARFITVTSKYLLKTGKFNIYYFTDKPYYKEFSYEPEIKRYIAHNNYTLMRNISKNEKIDIVVLQNVLSNAVVKFHRNLGQKVICMFHGVFMSSMYGNDVSSYKNWNQFDSCDSFIFISPDDYYFYNRLGFKNAIFMPNLYTFEPSEIESSNLTNNNIVILGRLNDHIKGVKYAIEAMEYIVKEVPDATLSLISSDSRVQFLKNLTRDLNLTNNIIFRSNTYNLTKLFHNSSVHMYTSLSEAFPMALNEGKAHGMPVVGFDVPYSLPYQKGFIGVKLFDVEGLARETIKLLKDYNYRKRKGEEAKKSLDILNNNETVHLWVRLCDSLLSNNSDDYKKLQEDMEKKYYNETKAREHLESQFNILLKYDINLTCHSFDNFTDINYLKNIKKCNFSSIFNNTTNNN